jgi:hypothetical protein
VRNCGVFEAGKQNAFAHHAGGTGDDDVELGWVCAHGFMVAGLLFLSD